MKEITSSLRESAVCCPLLEMRVKLHLQGPPGPYRSRTSERCQGKSKAGITSDCQGNTRWVTQTSVMTNWVPALFGTWKR